MIEYILVIVNPYVLELDVEDVVENFLDFVLGLELCYRGECIFVLLFNRIIRNIFKHNWCTITKTERNVETGFLNDRMLLDSLEMVANYFLVFLKIIHLLL